MPDTVFAYRIEGDSVIPTDFARGPWYGDQQHGGAVLGLLARFLEHVPAARAMRLTRLTADLSRPVPMERCTVTARALRDGRRVQSLEAVLAVEGNPVARAVATRIRTEAGLVPADKVSPMRDEDRAPEWLAETIELAPTGPNFHRCLEVRERQDPDGLGRLSWLRLVHPLVEAEEPSPLVRVASVADLVPSSAQRLGPGWMSINPEVAFHLERDPGGEWIAISGVVRLGDDGTGVSEGVLHDRAGRVGRTSKCVLNVPR